MIGNTSALAPTIGQTGFQIGVSPAVLWLNGIYSEIPFSFVFVQPNTTSYIYLNMSSGLLGVNNTGFIAQNLPIAIVTTGLTKVVSCIDKRPDIVNFSSGGGGGTGPNFVDNVTPSGVINNTNTIFTLGISPSPGASLLLSLNGQLLRVGLDYTLNATSISFSIAPTSGDVIQAWYRYGFGGVLPLFSDGEIPSGVIDGVNTTFTVANNVSPSASAFLTLNGQILAQGSDYTLVGSTITMAIAPVSGDSLQVWYRYGSGGTNVNFSDAEIPSGTVNGTNAHFVLNASPSPPLSLILTLNGQVLEASSDYVLTGQNITFTVPPSTGDSLEAWYRF